tara:strand:- start:4 stop:1134 length:1131 start_codon:yes stop_codon:yes gene_type:complete
MSEIQSEGLSHVSVFVDGEDGYDEYSVPAIITSKKGTLLAFTEAAWRENRKTPQERYTAHLALKRSFDNGRTWGELQVLAECERGRQKRNPCAVVDQISGTIWLTYVIQDARKLETGLNLSNDNVAVINSDYHSDGTTWSEERIITDQVKPDEWGFYATGPGVGIQLRRGTNKGRLMIPCDHSKQVEPWDDSYFEHGGIHHAQHSHVFYSDDRGVTWQIGGAMPPDTDECHVVELQDGSLQLNMRQYTGPKCRGLAESNDGGVTWSGMTYNEELVDSMCQACCVRYSFDEDGEKNRLLFSNPASTSRENMTVKLSYDEGKTWPVSKLIYDGAVAYSCVTRLANNEIGLLYWLWMGPRTIFSRFSLEWLTDGQDSAV